MQLLRPLSPEPTVKWLSQNLGVPGLGVHSWEAGRRPRAMQRWVGAAGLWGDADCLHSSEVKTVFMWPVAMLNPAWNRDGSKDHKRGDYSHLENYQGFYFFLKG